ncbi:hypothetical protein MHY01S_29890 [Meiothermus hypogaeus NBRC 106114]|uniref:Uncharacterized protein n=1 Tax=Meiothermus hypogaeus NBRC 106114 TaxID=1227553 RepID=A0A511R5D9_9DEIN|nr:hypothetical protein MHY01S_29890 [Meiothermus hypogaeus NBRC 106114]
MLLIYRDTCPWVGDQPPLFDSYVLGGIPEGWEFNPTDKVLGIQWVAVPVPFTSPGEARVVASPTRGGQGLPATWRQTTPILTSAVYHPYTSASDDLKCKKTQCRGASLS